VYFAPVHTVYTLSAIHLFKKTKTQQDKQLGLPVEARPSLLNISRQATTQLRVASLATGVWQVYGDHFGRYFRWRYCSLWNSSLKIFTDYLAMLSVCAHKRKYLNSIDVKKFLAFAAYKIFHKMSLLPHSPKSHLFLFSLCPRSSQPPRLVFSTVIYLLLSLVICFSSCFSNHVTSTMSVYTRISF